MFVFSYFPVLFLYSWYIIHWDPDLAAKKPKVSVLSTITEQTSAVQISCRHRVVHHLCCALDTKRASTPPATRALLRVSDTAVVV